VEKQLKPPESAKTEKKEERMAKYVILQRHGAHGNGVDYPKNALQLKDFELLRSLGKQLFQVGLKIVGQKPSPAGRAVETGVRTLSGYAAEQLDKTGKGEVPPTVGTEYRICDSAIDPRFAAVIDKVVKTSKEKYGSASDRNLALVLQEQEYHGLMLARAEEGAQAVCEAAGALNDGEAVLMPSHGVAMIEIVLRYLKGMRGEQVLDIADEIIENCGVRIVVFENDKVSGIYTLDTFPG